MLTCSWGRLLGNWLLCQPDRLTSCQPNFWSITAPLSERRCLLNISLNHEKPRISFSWSRTFSSSFLSRSSSSLPSSPHPLPPPHQSWTLQSWSGSSLSCQWCSSGIGWNICHVGTRWLKCSNFKQNTPVFWPASQPLTRAAYVRSLS